MKTTKRRRHGHRKKSPPRSSGAKMKQRQFGWLAKLLATFISTALAIAAAEAATRILNLAPEFKPIELSSNETAYQRSTNPLLAFELKPNYRNENADCLTNYPQINSHGQRDVERLVEKPENVTRIILLGDSIVEGLEIRNLQDTIAGQWEKLFTDRKVEVLNFGVSAYNTLAEVELLRTKGLKFQPDWVVLIFTENDFDNFNREAFLLAAKGERPAFVNTLFRKSHLVRTCFTRFNLFQFRAETDPLAWNQEAMGDNNVVDGLRLLKRLSEAYGFRVLIAVWPRFTAYEIKDIHFMPDSSDELVIERLAATEGLPCDRLSRGFQRDWEVSGKKATPCLIYTVGDEMHPSIYGCRVAAVALMDSMMRLMDNHAGDSSADDLFPNTRSGGINAAKALGFRKADYAKVFHNTAWQFQKEGNVDKAIEYYRKALEENPNYVDAHNNLSIILAEQGRFDEAIVHSRKAIEERPNHIHAHHNLGRMLAEQGRFDEALVHFRKTVKLDPNFFDGYLNLGFILHFQGEYDEAIETLRRALSIQTGIVGIHLRLGDCYEQKGMLDKAIAHYEEELKLDSDNALAHFGLGRALLAGGKLERAIQNFKQTLAIDPSHDAARQALDAAQAALTSSNQ